MSPTVDAPEVRVGEAEGHSAYLLFADDSGEPAGFTLFFPYDEDGEAQRIFPHTVVKDEFGGHGLASVLVKEALDASIAEGFTIVALCPYIKTWLKKHPDYAQHTVEPNRGHIDTVSQAVKSSR
ncbi:GNAT family N-acetyltransferase [Rothia aerolata]|uniref:N-acetyltransferase domain-containing protein n=1 Tax=Rothia aerolata TaxID=1812262 RepID=A0A917IWU6_9MICC|nr:GNAT family N-acetyltransferase [Rothia aerolata]GGH66974.1 hypothetical protein GCM10007359_21650 [Rothia aerolata]